MIKQNLFNGGVEVGISEIDDGNMRFFGDGSESGIIENQRKLGELIGLKDVVRVRTIYGERQNFTEYTEITKENLFEYSIDNFEKEIPVSDGLVTRETEIGILLPLADCLGVVAFDEKQRIIGLLHSGRQNIEQDGPRKFIEYFVDDFGCNVKNIKLWFSPYALNYCIFKLNKGLGEAAKDQFINAGILSDNIIDSRIDTVSNDNFPSNSDGDTTKRFAIAVKQRQVGLGIQDSNL